MLIQHWMCKKVITATPETSLLKCRALLKDNKLTTLPVVDAQNRVVGIISKPDYTRFLPLHATGMEILESLDSLSKMRVADHMKKNPQTIDIDAPLEDAAQLMIEKSVSYLPVVDKDGKLLGVITEWDIFKSLVSIMGVNREGIQISCEAENKQGSLGKILADINKLNFRLIAVLSKIRETDGRRLISIRCRASSEEEEQALIDKLTQDGVLRYWAKDHKTHLVNVDGK